MTKLEELIKELCPNGVEFYSLAEIGTPLSGMSAVTGKWKEEGNCRFIDYMNVYKHIQVDVSDLPYATVKNVDKQTALQKGDVLFTAASETPDECALSAVIADDLPEGILLDDHLFGLRINDDYKKHVTTGYLKYIFRSENFRNVVQKTVRGVTRHYIAKPAFLSLQIPLPPLAVQCEIVRILDDFTSLSAELAAELAARRKQYEYYRGKLLSFDKLNSEYEVRWLRIGDVCAVSAGGDIPKDCVSSKQSSEYSVPIISNGIGANAIYGYTSNAKITEPAVTVAARGTIGYAEYRDYPYYPIIRLLSCISLDTNKLNTKYLYYCLQGKQYPVPTAGIPQLIAPELKKVQIPVPPLEVQEKIVETLDKFDKLCNDLSEGLPAEIEARQKQYEYYRDKLLTFEPTK